MFQMKEQEKHNRIKTSNKMKISNLLDKGFKVMVLRLLTKLGRTEKLSVNINKEKI